MATNNRGGNRSRSRNNNPEGRNQYSGWTDTAKDRPFATAAAAAAAVGAGVFLWSRRNQISDQLTNLNDQISAFDRVRTKMREQLQDMHPEDRQQIEEASTVLRKSRASQGLPTTMTITPIEPPRQ